MCNYIDGELLDDPVKGAHLTQRERKYAEYLRERPSFEDWCHYNFFLPFSFIGDFYEYGAFIDFINYQGDVKKMRPLSNFVPALQRFCEQLLCWTVYYQMGQMANIYFMAEPEFLEYPMM